MGSVKKIGPTSPPDAARTFLRTEARIAVYQVLPDLRASEAHAALDHPRVGLIRLDYADRALTDVLAGMK